MVVREGKSNHRNKVKKGVDSQCGRGVTEEKYVKDHNQGAKSVNEYDLC